MITLLISLGDIADNSVSLGRTWNPSNAITVGANFDHKDYVTASDYEDGILTKSELEERVKKLNEEIDTLKFRLNEVKQDIMLLKGEYVPF